MPLQKPNAEDRKAAKELLGYDLAKLGREMPSVQAALERLASHGINPQDNVTVSQFIEDLFNIAQSDAAEYFWS